MRVLYVSHSFPPLDEPLASVGGMQRVATELYDALGRHPQIRLRPLLLRSAWRSVHWKMPAFLYRTYRTIAAMAERREIDAVLFSSMVTGALAWPLRRTLRANGIVTAAIAHGQDVTLPVAPYQRFLPRFFDALDAVLPVSNATGSVCLERGLDAEKLCVVPNGVDLRRFRPLADRDTMRREMLEALATDDGLPDNALLLCSVGRQVERKGLAWFVDRVLPLLPPDVHYWLAGDGPEADNIRAAAARNGLTNRIRLLGRISDRRLEALYRGSDLFMMPNIPVPGTMEGFGVVMLEAGVCGLPAVASRLEGIQDVITEDRNGHLVESRNPWAFSEAIMPYYHDRPRLAEAAEKAATHTAATFGWKAVAHRYVSTLYDIAGLPFPTTPQPTFGFATARR